MFVADPLLAERLKLLLPSNISQKMEIRETILPLTLTSISHIKMDQIDDFLILKFMMQQSHPILSFIKFKLHQKYHNYLLCFEDNYGANDSWHLSDYLRFFRENEDPLLHLVKINESSSSFYSAREKIILEFRTFLQYLKQK